MSNLKKHAQAVMAAPKDGMRFRDVERVLIADGWEQTNVDGSHHIFEKHETILTIITTKGKRVKRHYLQRINRHTDLRYLTI